MKDKVPFYEIANMFFTGAAFSIVFVVVAFRHQAIHDLILELLDLFKDWIVVVSVALLVAMYEIGFILNKISSVFLGRLLEKTKIWPREHYSISVSQLEEKNAKFKSLNTELHVTRTHIIMYLILSVISLLLKKWVVFAIFLLIAIIFLFAGRRTNNFMNKITEDYSKGIEASRNK